MPSVWEAGDLELERRVADLEDRPKLSDFGIARIAGAGTLTEAGTVLGTATYISPEQAGGKGATPASDVYTTKPETEPAPAPSPTTTEQRETTTAEQTTAPPTTAPLPTETLPTETVPTETEPVPPTTTGG